MYTHMYVYIYIYICIYTHSILGLRAEAEQTTPHLITCRKDVYFIISTTLT